jgi:uncharacterized protein YjbJ (UPF0337 family)
MSELTDKAKGKVKETVGTAKDDPQLQGEGRTDRTKGEAVDKAKHEVQEAVDRHRDRQQ